MTPLSSRVATDISWSPLSGLQGAKLPVDFGERTRYCSPGHAEKEVEAEQVSTSNTIQTNRTTSVSRYQPTEHIVETSETDELYGYFTITYYCACTKCCGAYATGTTASGTHVQAGRTIAAPSRYAFGTKMKIFDNIYTVEDRGGAITGNKIDIYVDSHEEALRLGKQTNVPVYKVN